VALLAFGASVYGVPQGVTNEIVEVRAGWPAAAAGLRPGDRIVAIDGARVDDGQRMVRTIHQSAGRLLVLDIQRGTETFQVRVTPRLEPRLNVGATGITPGVLRARYGPLPAIGWGAQQSARYVSDIFVGLARIFRAGRVLEELSGPVGAVRVLGDAARAGLDSYLFMTAFLSVMIGMFNLLPLPALDGGRLMFLLVEAVRRRAVDPRREGYIHLVGFALLIALILVLTFRDLTRWGAGG
jgi:regulator of sigma E protease